MRTRSWSSGLVVEAAGPTLPVAVQPLVAGIPADAVAHAEFGHRPMATIEIVYKMLSFEHGIGLQPGHRRSSQEFGEVSPMCPDTCHLCTQVVPGRNITPSSSTS